MKKLINFFAFLFIVLSITAQQKNIDSLEKDFNHYQVNNFQEKIFIHADRSFYLSGETIWFKLYNVDAYLHRPSMISKVAYVELISAEQKPVLQASIELQEGAGAGSFQLSTAIPSGQYILRSYTSWMKNFSVDYYFEQPLTIVNTFRNTLIKSSLLENKKSVQFFPEGGNLVEGLSSVLAFKAVDQAGKGVDCRGVIVNQQKDTVTAFVSGYKGMGHFDFKPVKGMQYAAIVQFTDTLIQVSLPAAAASGYSMSVKELADEWLVTIQSSDPVANEPVHLFVHTRQLPRYYNKQTVQSGKAAFAVSKKVLGEGISHFTVFDKNRQPVCERLVFKNPENNLAINVSTDQLVYDRRKRVKVSLESIEKGAAKSASDLSMAVFLLDSLQSVPAGNIQSYLLLQSDLKGIIETPEYYLGSGPEVSQAVDDLLMTQGWRRFSWQDVLESKKPAFNFLAEMEGQLIRGTLIDKTTNRPANNVETFLSVPGKQFAFNTSSSKESGDILFNVKFYGRREMVIQTNKNDKARYRVDIANPFSDRFSQTSAMQQTISRTLEAALNRRSIGAQVENSYDLENKFRLQPRTGIDSLSFYGRPDKHYNLDDYTRFITMEEVMREYVPEVRVRKQENRFNFRVKNSMLNDFFFNEPLILVDGVAVTDADKIMELDPLKIKSLDVLTQKYFSGSWIKEGIVSYSTYEGDLAGYTLDPDAIVVSYEGLQQQRQFYSPDYSTEELYTSHLPDRRNLLYWQPYVKMDQMNRKKTQDFYTSDVPGRYLLLIQGISNQGKPVAGTCVFEVK
jgi:hypothetical protein